MAINTEMKVTGISQYKQAMSQANQSVKTLDAQLKQAEAQYKATGDKEQYMADKSKLLKQRMEEQQKAAKQAEQAMKQMRTQGVDPSNASYQRMAQELAKAQTGILETTVQLDNLTRGEMEATKGADQLTASINGISKKISMDQVIGGIDRITGGLENAAKKAVALGEQIWNSIMDAARNADDTVTMADMYGIDLTTLKQMQGMVAGGADWTVDAVLTAQRKLRQGIGNKSDSVAATLKELGVTMGEWRRDSSGKLDFFSRDNIDLFWEAGDAIMNLGDEFKQEAYAQKLFGRQWRDLVPLFHSFASKHEFEDALEGVNIETDQATKNLAELADQVAEAEKNFQVFKNQILGDIAPELTKVAGSVSALLVAFTEYAQTEQGQEMITKLGDAIAALFSDLTELDPEKAIEGMTGAFEKITNALGWLEEHGTQVADAIKLIVGAWAGLKIVGVGLTITQVVANIKGWLTQFGKQTAQEVVTQTPTDGGKGKGILDWLRNRMPTIEQFTDPRQAVLDVVRGTNAGAVSDWFWNNTYLGQTWRDTGDLFGSIGKAWDYHTNNIKTNAGSFFSDWENLFNTVFGGDGEGGGGGSHGFKVPVKPDPVDNSAEIIQQVIGPVPITLVPRISPTGFLPGTGRTSSMMSYVDDLMEDLHHNANGLPFVPYDNYPALLHRGERVVPARAVNSSNYSSNLYVEHMTMNGGIDADGLAARMAAAQKRTMSGYGS